MSKKVTRRNVGNNVTKQLNFSIINIRESHSRGRVLRGYVKSLLPDPLPKRQKKKIQKCSKTNFNFYR